jgi:aspartyl protease family protein
MRTANGTATVYRTRLDQVSLGGLTQNNVRGSINPHVAGDYILLGMTFLGGIDFSQSDGVLTLREN